jgi:hypothetical protein
MASYASLGLGVAPVNGICPIPEGARGIPVEGLPRITYQALLPRGRPVADDVRNLFDHLTSGSQARRGT